MNPPAILALAAAALIAIGLFAAVAHRSPLRRILGVNLLGCGIFLAFGIAARRGASAGLTGDPVPHALVITGVVVAFAATAIALALMRRLAELDGSDGERPVREGAPPAGGPAA
ncbi:MAG: NADH-quinone oxidoreductase subunit K [Alsobacter sp.]